MTPDIDDTAGAGLAVIMTEISHIKTTLDDIKSSLKDVPRDYVTRTEFDQVRTGHDREIRELKDQRKADYNALNQSIARLTESIATDRRARHIPMPMTITTVVSLGGFVILLIEKIAA